MICCEGSSRSAFRRGSVGYTPDMDIFDHLPSELLTLVKKDGRRFENLRAIVATGKILTNDASIPIEDGDEFVRKLPSGTEERFTIVDAGYQPGFGNIMPAHYQSHVRKSTAPRSPAPQHFHLTGPNSRVNIDSHDASTNIVHNDATALFMNIRSAVRDSAIDATAKQSVIERLEALESSAGQKTFQQRYTDFISSAANHATLMATLAPYLPALSQLVK